MKTKRSVPLRQRSRRAAATAAAAVAAVFVLRAIASAQSGIDLAPLRAALGAVTSVLVVWGLVVPAALYALYLAIIHVAPALVRGGVEARAAARIRRAFQVLIAVSIVGAVAAHYGPVLARAIAERAATSAVGTAAGLGNAARTLADHGAAIVLTLALVAVLGGGYWWATRARGIETWARMGMVGGPVIFLLLALSRAGVLGP